jgi:hypothetical protein
MLRFPTPAAIWLDKQSNLFWFHNYTVVEVGPFSKLGLVRGIGDQ